MRKNFGIFIVLLSALFSWNCGESTAPTPRDSIGTYDLVSFKGKALPVLLDDTLSLVSSVMVLGSDDSYRETITYSSAGVQTIRNFDGVFSSDGRLVLVQFSTGGGFQLEVADKRYLTENDANGIIVYRKR